MMLSPRRRTPTRPKSAPSGLYRVACVDLNRQVTWVQKGGKVVFGPVPMRSGRKGYRPAPAGTPLLAAQVPRSTLYNQPRCRTPSSSTAARPSTPIYGSVYTPGGSWGCVNLKLADAK